MVIELYTIGYEGTTQDAVLDTLRFSEVKTLLDIRQLPLSRKPGFSKTALAGAAARYGIGYDHLRAPGTPPELRAQRKIDYDEAAFRRGYLEYLATQEDAMTALIARIQQERCCLLCYEADPRFCHRSFVAERVRERTGGAVAIVDLHVGQETR